MNQNVRNFCWFFLCHVCPSARTPHLLTSLAIWNTMAFCRHWDLETLKLNSDLEYAVLQVLSIKLRLWIWGLNHWNECKTTHMQSWGGNLCFWSEAYRNFNQQIDITKKHRQLSAGSPQEAKIHRPEKLTSISDVAS